MLKDVHSIIWQTALKKQHAALGIAADTPHPVRTGEEYERKARPIPHVREKGTPKKDSIKPYKRAVLKPKTHANSHNI